MAKGTDGLCVVERRVAALRRATGASAHSPTRTVRRWEAAGLVSRHRERRWGPCRYARTAAGQRTLEVLDHFGADSAGIKSGSGEICNTL